MKMEGTKTEKTHQVHTFFSDTSGRGGKGDSNPVIEPISELPHVCGSTSGNSQNSKIKRFNLECREGIYILYHRPDNQKAEIIKKGSELNFILTNLPKCSILCNAGYQTKVFNNNQLPEIHQWFNGAIAK